MSSQAEISGPRLAPIQFSPTDTWFALHVRTNHEKSVCSALREKGFETFLPTVGLTRRWKDRVVSLDTPLFPGYAFSKFDSQRPLPVLRTNGVLQVLGYGSRPSAVPVDRLSAILRMTTIGSRAVPFPYLRIGQRINVRTGPLAGLDGILVRRKGLRYLVVSIDILNRSVATEIDLADIKP